MNLTWVTLSSSHAVVRVPVSELGEDKLLTVETVCLRPSVSSLCCHYKSLHAVPFEAWPVWPEMAISPVAAQFSTSCAQ